MSPRRLFWSLLLVCWAVPTAAQSQSFSERIDAVLGDSVFLDALWGVQVMALDRDTTLYAYNAERNFIPASNMKLYTSAAALERLGPDYRYATQVYIDGPIDDGILRGNVIIRGAGDPTLGGRLSPDDAIAPLRAWADSLKVRGVQHIEGDIVGDDDVFSDTPYGVDWAWGDLQYYWAAEIGGLAFRENVIDVEMQAQRPGEPAQLSWEPIQTSYVSFLNATRTGPSGSSLDEGHYRYPGTNRFRLFSEIPPGGRDRETLSVTNPTLYLTHVFREVLLEEGISVDGTARDVDDLSLKPSYAPGRAQVVATFQSPDLAEIAQAVNTESVNLYAEHLLRTLGIEHPPQDPPEDVFSGSADMGILAARDAFGAAGIDTSRMVIADGSGLSRLNLVSPAATTTLLRHMWQHPDSSLRAAYLASLARPGRDGTLSYRLRGLPSGTEVRAKTGTLTQASALSGYVTTSDGAAYAFAIFCNNYSAKVRRVRVAQDRIVQLIAQLAP